MFCGNHALVYLFFFAREKWSAIDEVCAKLHGNWTVMELKDDWEPTENKRESS